MSPLWKMQQNLPPKKFHKAIPPFSDKGLKFCDDLIGGTIHIIFSLGGSSWKHPENGFSSPGLSVKAILLV